jgi:hypothetical protein
MTKVHWVFKLAPVLAFCGCMHTVNLTVQNALPASPPPPSLDISAVTKDSNGMEQGTTRMGTATPSHPVSASFKVKDKGSYLVKANLTQGGAQVYSGGEKTVTGDTTDTLPITSLIAPVLDVTDTSQIQQVFSSLGPQIGFNPVTLRSALTSLYGGLVVFQQPKNGTPGTLQPVVEVPAPSFTGAVTYESFVWPTTSSTQTVDISTDSSVKAGAFVPLWGSLTASFSANSVYKLNWDMEGYGNVLKADAAGSTFQSKLASLDQPTKDDICSRLSQPDVQLLYVNQMYVVRSAILSFQKGDTVSASAGLSGGSIVTASGAYDFSNAQTQTSRADEQVVNIAGPSWTKSTVSFCNAGPAIAVAPGALATPPPAAVPVLHVPGAASLLGNTVAARITLGHQ